MHQKQDMVHGDVLSRAFFLRGKDFRIEDCYSEYTSSFNGRLHFHDFYELSIIYEGSSRFMVNGSVFDLGACSMHLARPSDYHRQMTRKEEHIRYYNLQFSESFLSPELIRAIEECERPLCTVIPADEQRNLMRLVQAIGKAHDTEADDPLTRLFIRCNTENLCLVLLRDAARTVQERTETMHEPIRRALTRIQRQYREELRLNDVADAVGLSPSYFSALFHETIGETFSAYLTDYRLQIACRYLRNGGLSVKQIAALCGFGSYSYFVTVFRKRYGVPPKQWRDLQ